MSQKSDHQSQAEVPLIDDSQFEYVEFFVIKDTTYKVGYVFVKPNQDSTLIDSAMIIVTGIEESNILECSKKVTNLINNNLFSIPVSTIGVLYDPTFKEIEEFDWGELNSNSIKDQTIAIH
jgi:hypothetical protein